MDVADASADELAALQIPRENVSDAYLAHFGEATRECSAFDKVAKTDNRKQVKKQLQKFIERVSKDGCL
eukprot:1195130-Pyramimonas_sp.AAC.1